MRRLTVVLIALACVSADAQESNITPAAEITATPAIEAARIPSLVDGQVGRGVAFEVGTSGEGSLALDFGSPRTVTGVRFFQVSDVYYTSRYAIEGDADGDGEFELALAQGDDAPIEEWIEHRWEPVTVQSIRVRSVEGFSGGRRAHPVFSEVEVLGPPLPGDSERAAALGNPVSTVSAPRALRRSTPLVVEGRPPVIVRGDDLASAAAADALADSIANALGQDVDVVADPAEAGLGERTVLAVGNCVSNPLIARLFHNWYALEDNAYPGQGGYTLRTVTDPYPWRGGVDVIVVGGSDSDGLMAGAERLSELISDAGELPRLLEVVSDAAPDAAAVRAATAEEPPPTFAAFLDAVREWQRWGDEAYARRAARALDMMVQTYREDPDRDIPWNEETQSGPIFAAWEAFEPSPELTDEQRLDYTRAFLSLLYSIPQHVSGYATLEQNDLVTWNHTTFPLLGLYFGGRYFGHYHHITVCDEYLRKAHHTFGAQARSWKPQEDADSYITHTMDHTIRYCLAEGRDEWIDGGNMARYADYMVGICDSRGWAGGFGDSHYSSNPGLLQRALPLAFLTTADPGYRWVLEHVDPDWVNPYHAIPGERPDRFVGVNVFPLDGQLYEYTQTHPYYNEPLVRSEVAPEDAWDKIAMRESWDPDAQYLLMDGFGRGKHLHYDTNAITEYVADGERWLADHDYLIRNTTEHCMLTVLRDGRGDTLIPSMAGLVAASDTADWGVVRTGVPAYSGLDWDRSVIWRKGRYFVVLDGVTAREAGQYDLELTWKTEDMDAQWLEDGRVFVADRSASAASTTDVLAYDDADASGGRAVALGEASSRLASRFELPGGEYRLEVRGYGIDGSHDSVWVRIDGGDPLGFGVPQGGYGGQMGAGPSPTAGHEITVPEGDVHVMLVTLRELPPVHLDRFTFYRGEDPVLTIEAEDAEDPGPEDGVIGEPKRFYIKSAEPVRSRITTHQSQGISIPLCVLHQRQGMELAPGEQTRFASVFYNLSTRRQGQYDLVHAGDTTWAVTGDDRALIALDSLSLGDLDCAAQVIVGEPGRLLLTDATAVTVAGEGWTSEEPTDLSVDLATGEIGAHGAAGTSPARRIAVTDDTRAALEALLAARPPDAAPDDPGAAAEQTEPRWRVKPGVGEIRRLQTADLDGDGELEVLVAQGRGVHCMTLQGEALWSFATDGTVLDIADVQAREHPGREVAVSSADTRLYVLSAEGELLDQHQPVGPPHDRTFGDRPWKLWVIDGLDIDADGLDELFTVMDNYKLIALDQDWTRLWQYGQVAHGAMDIRFADWDRDGVSDIFVSDRYGFVHGVSREGERLFIGYSSIGDVQFDVAPLTGEGLSVIYGSSTGDLLSRGPDATVAWRFDNYGYPVKRILAADITGDANPEVLIASATGYLYAVNATGDEIWRDRVGFAANDVAVRSSEEGTAEIITASEDGHVRLYDGDGSERRTIVTPGPARLVQAPRADGPILVGTAEGEIVGY